MLFRGHPYTQHKVVSIVTFWEYRTDTERKNRPFPGGLPLQISVTEAPQALSRGEEDFN